MIYKPMKSVEQFLMEVEVLPNDLYLLIELLREYFLAAAPDLEEIFKYGGLAYLKNGKLVGGIFVFTNHVTVEFSQGILLDDPYGNLQGTGKYRRHIKFTSVDQVETSHIKDYLEQTVWNCRKW